MVAKSSGDVGRELQDAAVNAEQAAMIVKSLRISRPPRPPLIIFSPMHE